jgi:AcrR family transcriptional regulator
MDKGANTRETIVAEALRQATTAGLEGLSFGALADGLGLSKSGLFAHFKAKESLQLAILEQAGAQFRDLVVAPALTRPRGRPQLVALFSRYLDWMSDGCLYSTVAQEMDKLPEPVRVAFREGQRQWQQTIARLATDAVGPRWSPEVVLQFVGLALAYQQTVKVFQDTGARRRVLKAFTRTLETIT